MQDDQLGVRGDMVDDDFDELIRKANGLLSQQGRIAVLPATCSVKRLFLSRQNWNKRSLTTWKLRRSSTDCWSVISV